MNTLGVKLLVLVAELMLATSSFAQPTEPLTIHPIGYLRSGYAYEVLDYATVNRGEGKRKDSWRRDQRQSAEWSANQADYYASGYVKFHLAPVEDFADQLWKDRTFVYANCAPGNKGLNNGPWKALENQIRLSADKVTTLYVFTAPLLLADEAGTLNVKVIGDHKIPVPTHFAKSVLQVRDSRPSMTAWIAANTEPADDATYEDWRTSVDQVEFAAGVDLYCWLDDEIERKLEAAKPVKW